MLSKTNYMLAIMIGLSIFFSGCHKNVDLDLSGNCQCELEAQELIEMGAKVKEVKEYSNEYYKYLEITYVLRKKSYVLRHSTEDSAPYHEIETLENDKLVELNSLYDYPIKFSSECNCEKESERLLSEGFEITKVTKNIWRGPDDFEGLNITYSKGNEKAIIACYGGGCDGQGEHKLYIYKDGELSTTIPLNKNNY